MVYAYKENDITTLIVEGGWTSDDNNSSFAQRPNANSGMIFTMKTVLKYKIIILLLHTNYLLFCRMLEKYPIFLSNYWLITKRRVVADARRVVAAARRVFVVARSMTSCCLRLPTHPHLSLCKHQLRRHLFMNSPVHSRNCQMKYCWIIDIEFRYWLNIKWHLKINLKGILMEKCICYMKWRQGCFN